MAILAFRNFAFYFLDFKLSENNFLEIEHLKLDMKPSSRLCVALQDKTKISQLSAA